MFAVEVIEKTQETADIVLFRLARIDRSALPTFSPGAHIDIQLPDGLIRQYSLCNSPLEPFYYEIGVFNDPNSRGGSIALHQSVTVGDSISISDPRNLFALEPNANHHLLIAAGIGVTPLLCMAEYLAKFDDSFKLYYCAKSPSQAAFKTRIEQAQYTDQVTFQYSQTQGRLDIKNALAGHSVNTHLYVCGPNSFMDAVLDTARAEGWQESLLHREYFSAVTGSVADDCAFEIQIASSGEVIHISAEQSALTALLDKGIDIPFACEEGVCGSCATGLLEGAPQHRDVFMTPEEHATNAEFAPCCSRANGTRLVLDL